MGMDIDISKLEGNLKLYARLADGQDNGNEKIDTEKELSIFKGHAQTAVQNGEVTDADYKAVFGSEIKTPTPQTAKAPVSNPVTLTKKQVKDHNERVKDSVKEMVKSGVAPKDLMAKLEKEYSNSAEYKQMLDEVNYTLNLVNGTNYDSKEGVENIHKKVKAQLKQDGKWDDFHKDLLDSLEKQAKTAQIYKEFKAIVAEYESVKTTMQKTEVVKQNGDNFKAYVEIVKDKLKKDKTWKESYTKEAFEQLEDYARKDAKKLVESRLANETGATTKKGLRRELRGMNKGGDDYQNDAIQDIKTDRKVFARKHKVENKANALSSITADALRTELGKRGYQYNFAKKASAHKIGNEIFEKLNKSYLPTVMKEDGTYDLSKLSEEIASRVGQDYKVNLSKDDKMSELKNIQNHLRSITGQDFTNNETKVLINMLGFDREHKDHTPKILKTAVGAVGGAAAALSASSKLNVSQAVELTIENSTIAKDIIKQLEANGVKPGVTELADGSINITVLQEYMRDNTITNILKGAGIGALTNALFDIVIGDGKDEKSCMSISDYDINDPTYTDAEKYKEYVANVFKKNPEKVDALHTLVDAYKEKFGEQWHAHFQQALRDMAGVGSKLNPEECRMIKYNKPKDVDNNNHDDDNVDNDHDDGVHNDGDGDGDDIVPNHCDVEMRETPETDTTFTHKVKFGDSWSEIVKAYFPNYKECFGTLEGSKGAIRALKKALATDADGKLNNALYQKLLAGYIPKELNIPAELGGCKRNDEGKVQFKKPVGRPKGYMGAVGARTKTDGSVEVADCTGTRGKGATTEQALADLNKKTGKHYTEADITERK